MLQQVLEVMRNNPSYGYRRVAQTLGRNHKPVQRVMQMLIESPQGLSDIYVTDFTYPKWQKRTLYVSTMLDLFTREIVSVVVLTTHAVPLVLNTLLQAIHDRPPPRIIHSDQGSEYTSLAYQSLCTDLGISQSMSRRGCPWENGFQESWYDKFKKELGDPNRYTNLGELSAAIYHAIAYYNHNRIHSALKMSPKQFASQFVFKVQ